MTLEIRRGRLFKEDGKEFLFVNRRDFPLGVEEGDLGVEEGDVLCFELCRYQVRGLWNYRGSYDVIKLHVELVREDWEMMPRTRRF